MDGGSSQDGEEAEDDSDHLEHLTDQVVDELLRLVVVNPRLALKGVPLGVVLRPRNPGGNKQ